MLQAVAKLQFGKYFLILLDGNIDKYWTRMRENFIQDGVQILMSIEESAYQMHYRWKHIR